MADKAELVVNALGRKVPTVVNGRAQVPYQGVGGLDPEQLKHAPPVRSCRDYPSDGDKRAASLREAFEKCGLRDGMVISSHHHLRNGDRVALQYFTGSLASALASTYQLRRGPMGHGSLNSQ